MVRIAIGLLGAVVASGSGAQTQPVLSYGFDGALVNVGSAGAAGNAAGVAGVLYTADTPSGSGHALLMGSGPTNVAFPESFALVNGSFTVMAWMRVDELNPGGASGIVFRHGEVIAPPFDQNYVLQFLGTENPNASRFRSTIRPLAGGGLDLVWGSPDEPTPVVLGDWNHIAVRLDTDDASGDVTFTMVVNGEVVDESIGDGLDTDWTGIDEPSIIGDAFPEVAPQPLPPGNDFRGALDDFRLYDTALTVGEIVDAAGLRCSPADLAPPFGVLDLDDTDAFIAGFGSADAIADLAEPAGVFDLSDIDLFITAFLGGCP